ncbi:DUF4255 domain-containing protein [Streptomyces sp. AC550_RSS872]|uniref:DUF4255 domain-containing protein n=1 Tax=Streptomyces sp. AC550_RSS872 TaxID=2823689 RepID=UPI001C25C3AA|nr:DUF4255 domain-containing protein [Streptomyces sp. AC550_RSS872]
MSNALAIAHVTQALALLLASNVGPEFDEAVKVEPHKPPTEPPDHPTLNVFLYQVTPNTSMRNNDLPTRALDGTLVKRPAAALDLHYLITAYGDETALVGQRLIGSVVRTLHDIPILPKDVIEETAQLPHLADSDLAQAAQRVRFTPTVMDIDETSKLWGMLYQTPYSLSVVYQATLVLIDGREKPVPAKPVERPDVRVLPFGAPGAPVPPGAGPKVEQPSTSPAPTGAEVSAADEPAPGRAAVKKTAKAPAKTVAKAPARPRRATRVSKSAQPEPRKDTEG